MFRLPSVSTREHTEVQVIAVGETGLDYARLEFCQRETQLKYFKQQIELALELDKPMFLHLRDAHSDFIDMMKALEKRPKGVVHSYDGPLDAAMQLVSPHVAWPSSFVVET
eukprot:m.92253 g.92253  ORF g.92253 m.92253 type:complete len:111 (+) comp14940_c1_seq12:337-669(+)